MRISRVFLGVIFFLLLIFTIFGFSADYLGGLFFAFLTIVVLIVIIFTTKTPKKTYPKGYGVNHLKETNSPRHEHATLGMGTGKKILLIAIITVVGFFVAGFGGVGLYSVLYPEEYADWSARLDREIEQDEALETQKRLAEQAQQRQEELKQQADPFLDAKKELNNFLQSLEKATLACNRLPDSVKISPLEKKVVDETVVNSVLMILVIEEAPIDSGLLPYKQKIITGVDRLTECLNRH